MCFTPERLAAEGASDNVLHPEYRWTIAEMSSAVNAFVSQHLQPIIILAINTFQLFDVPVVGGIPDYRLWNERTRNKELVIYLDCTATQIPFRHQFKQLGVVQIRPEPMNPPAEEVGGSNFFLCIVLLTPEIDGRRKQVGTNWRFHVGLSPSHIRLLDEVPIGVTEASENLTKSIMDSQTIKLMVICRIPLHIRSQCYIR